jgi:hypothetical protein
MRPPRQVIARATSRNYASEPGTRGLMGCKVTQVKGNDSDEVALG